MNRGAFYAALRRRGSGVFGTSLSQKQVEGVEAILDEGEKRGTSLFHLAAILAEAYHETGGQMQPVKETVYAHSKDRNPSDATVIQRLDTAFAKGKLPWVSKPYWRDGWFGRGLIQLTHKANYDKFGVTKQSALDLKTSVRVMFDGMEKGLFTGRKLADYDFLLLSHPPIPAFKYYASRSIVNGDMAVNGARIDTYGKAFEAALKEAGFGGATVFFRKNTQVGSITVTAGATDYGTPSDPRLKSIWQEQPSSGGWRAFWTAVLAMFNRSRA